MIILEKYAYAETSHILPWYIAELQFESAGQHEIMEILIRVLLCISSKHMDVFIKIVRLNYRWIGTFVVILLQPVYYFFFMFALVLNHLAASPTVVYFLISKVRLFLYNLFCFSSLQNIHCGECVTIEGQTYTVSAVTHRYQLRKGKYEPSEKRLDVQSTGRYILNLYLENLLQQS